MKAFLSSVIAGFEEWRAAARLAIELTNNTPIMAEDFGARSHSAQRACLEGVRASDIYILLLGERYGDRGDSGLSPTEEEFNEARALRLPLLVFVTSMAMEDEQKEFLARIRGWERGLMYARASTPDALKDEVVKALSVPANLRPFGIAPPAASFSELLDMAISDQEEVVVSMAWIPDADGKRFVSLGGIEALGGIVVSAVDGTLSIAGATEYRRERSIEVQTSADRETAFGYAQVFDDLRMSIGMGIRNDRDTTGMTHFFIDRTKVAAFVSGSLRFITRILEAVDPQGAIRGGWVQFKLIGLKYRIIGELPGSDTTSHTMPADIGNEVYFPSEAMQLPIRDLKDSAAPGTIVQALERRVDDLRRRRYLK